VCVSVADSGIGIDDETQRHLFEPFFTTKEAGRGTGLGLAAVYGTVKSHRGCIQVRSQIGEGTVFRLFLPVGSEARIAPPPRKLVPVLKGPIRILLVDDEPLVREATQRLLEVLGCEVTVCADGERAVEYYRAFHTSIDLAIVDMVMPVKDGGETFLAMREIDPKGKVLLASGYTQDGAARAVLERGANGFISKPYTQAQIWEKVVEILATESN
jgi:CheY-like chemotaxis protein